MANVKFTELPAASSVVSTTIIPVVDASGTPTNQKATASQLIGGLPDATTGNRGVMTTAQATQLANATNTNMPTTLVARDGSGDFAARNITANAVLGLATPVNATDAANKAYVDSAAAGLSVKSPARGATTGSNITLSGGAPTALDGLTLVANDRVLVKNQTDPKENGIYFVQTLGSGSNGTWVRTTDADTGAELVQGSYVFITAGTSNGGSSWVMTTANPVVIGTSNIIWFLYNQITNVPASAITGQIIASQIANAILTTAKFASGITPVEIVSSLPGSGNFAGRTVYLTSDGLLYRYNGSAFVSTLPTTALTGTITTTQITDNSISTAKLQANCVTAANIAANTITASQIAANTITAGLIAAGAIGTTELAVGGVTGTKIAGGTIATANIAAGAIIASLINVTNLSAITANMGTLTAGTINLGTGTSAISMSSAGLVIASGRISLTGDGSSNPWVRATGTGSFASSTVTMGAQNGSSPAAIDFVNGSDTITINGSSIQIGNTAKIINFGSVDVQASGTIKSSDSTGQINLFGGGGDCLSIVAGEDGSAGGQIGYAVLQLNGRAVKVPTYNL